MVDVAPAAERVDERAVGEPARDRVDGEIAPREVVHDGRVAVGDDLEVVPPGTRRPLAARRRELDPARREPADLAVARVQPQPDQAPGDDEVLDAPVRLEPRTEL